MPKKERFSLVRHDEQMEQLVQQTDHKTLAVWAFDCAERVMPYFESRYPQDARPRNALTALKVWVETGMFKMATIRKASLDSHAAARQVGEDNAARSAARAAGQAVATAHVRTHAIGAAIYGQQAVFRASGGSEMAVANERDWQYRRLLELRQRSS